MQTNRYDIHGKKLIKEEEIDTPMIYVNCVTQNKIGGRVKVLFLHCIT